MDAGLYRSSLPYQRDPHDWNTWDHYESIHHKRINEHPFIDRSRPNTVTFTEDAPGRAIDLTGLVYCRRGVVLEVDERLETRYIGSLRKVRGISYRYAAWVEDGHPVLRYHNIHFYDDYHHRVFDPRTGEEMLYETLERYQFPTLSEVIDEIEVVTRVLERQG